MLNLLKTNYDTHCDSTQLKKLIFDVSCKDT